MNIASWKDANDDVSGATTSRRREGEEDQEVATSGKTVIKKKPSSISSTSSTSWMKSKDPRIVRVSRAFGGKDRHSKVCTLRGLRDRRVRLSVPTAIQLYDLQERLGVDQPSKAVDWLLDAAKDEIDELPPLPVSPENFCLFNHHQQFLNLGQRLGQDPTQLGFKISGCVEESNTTTRSEENNKERGENDVVYASNHHIGSYIGTYHNMEQQHSSLQEDRYQHQHHHHHQHQLHSSLVPFPSQILVCPMTSSTTTQSLFPPSSSAGSANMETIDPRQMRGFPKRCRCGEAVVMKTSRTARNPGRLFHACPNGSEDSKWFHVFRWTDECMVEELEYLLEKVDEMEGDSVKIQKALGGCESNIETLEMETRTCEAVVEKEIQDCKMELRSLKNMIVCVIVMFLFYLFVV